MLLNGFLPSIIQASFYHHSSIILKIYFFVQVPGDGDCLFNSLVKQMIFKEDDGHKRHFACHIRQQAIVHFLHHLKEDEYKQWIIKQVKELYRSGEEGGVESFSVKSYLEYMVKDGSWGTIS